MNGAANLTCAIPLEHRTVESYSNLQYLCCISGLVLLKGLLSHNGNSVLTSDT